MDMRNEILRLIREQRDGSPRRSPTGDDPACHRPASRRLDGREMARVSPLPPPEEVFADWLLSVPHGADLAAAARRQIDIIDRRMSLHPDVRCLRMLLMTVAGAVSWRSAMPNL